MIFFDVPLVLTAALFFVLSWLYGWGLLKFHRYRLERVRLERVQFAWDLASIVGIASVVSCTYSLVWMVRGGQPVAPIQIPYDLAVVFLFALPGMTWVRVMLRDDDARKMRHITRLEERVQRQEQMMKSIEVIVKSEGDRAVSEIIKVLDVTCRTAEYRQNDIQLN